MFDSIITGKLHQTPTTKTSKNGNPFVVAKVITPTKNGGSVFSNVICFDTEACKALQALHKGDAVALAGEVTPTAYEAKDGTPAVSLDVLVSAVMTLYQIRKKRQAIQPAEPTPPPRQYPGVADIPDDLI